MQLARQLERLGTETAFAVSDMAAAWAAAGNRVFAFHLGDIKLPTPRPIVEAAARAMGGGYSGYCPGPGVPLLREQLARVLGAERGMEYAAENISVQPGGKPVIGKFLASVMNPGDEVLYPVPGFPIYRSQIDYQGGVGVAYHYRPNADGFALDLDELRDAVTPKTRALIYNNHHNPTGASASDDEIAAVAAVAAKHDLWVLADEAYSNIRFDDSPLRSIAQLPGMRERTVILFTCSKQFAMTGWRLGAAVGDAKIIAAISKFNTNIESCTAHFLQQAVGEVLREAGDDLPALIAPLVDALRERRDALTDALNGIYGVDVTAPPSAFYSYAGIDAILRRKNLPDADALMRASLHETGLSFCTGAHFGEAPDTRHIRFAFSSVSVDDIRESMAGWKRWVEA
ncbi:MAG: pyridoxal phosphate-dependent aminotransferase [Gammaproteobacteria bacterium]|nr:pyridoxal phosphate-dependent aminotransferase [Gammaproteobacteria bacterium]